MVLFFQGLLRQNRETRSSLAQTDAILWLRFARKNYEILHSYSKTRPFTKLNRYNRFQAERYRSGHNGGDSKSSVRPKDVPWVRIPPSPPVYLLFFKFFILNLFNLLDLTHNPSSLREQNLSQEDSQIH